MFATKLLTRINNFAHKYKTLLQQLLFTLFILIVFRIGAYLTIPGIKLSNLGEASTKLGFFDLLSILGGGALTRFSIFALGVSPYITASIITQLLSTDVIPVLSKWSKEGQKGRRKLELLTRILTVPFAITQGFATIFAMSKSGIIEPKWSNPTLYDGTPFFYYLLVGSILVAGSMLSLWIADQITMRGIGNGVSLLIATGIVINLPMKFYKVFGAFYTSGNELPGLLKYVFYVLMFLIIILLLVIFNESERRIPIQQTGSGLTAKSERVNYLPLKINSAGVIPVIFASALLTAPMTIAEIIKNTSPENGFVKFTEYYLSLNGWWGNSFYALFIILFTFLYSQIQINPERLSEDFQKSGTYLVGVKQGKMTEMYLRRLINRLSVLGSVFLALLACSPFLIAQLINLNQNVSIGGTGIIILVSVSLELVKQLRGRIIQHRFVHKKHTLQQEESRSLW